MAVPGGTRLGDTHCPAWQGRRGGEDARGCSMQRRSLALPAMGLSKYTFQLTLATVCPNPVVLVPGRCAEQAGLPQEAQCASGNHGGTGVPRHRDLQPGHIGDIFWVALLVVGSAERCRAGPGWCYGAGHVSLGTNSPRGSRWDPVAITHPLPGEERAVPAHHSPCSPQINYPARKKNEFLD